MTQLIVFTEEPSMTEVLKVLLPKIGVLDFKILTHQGVSDLKQSLPRKLRSWRHSSARFLVIRDNDRGDCVALKRELLEIVRDAAKLDQTKVRIVCQELEAWFIGDTEALRRAGLLKSKGIPKKLRSDPDQAHRPVDVLRTLKADYQKISGAQAIAPQMDPKANRSHSFRVTMAAAKELAST